jgi:hypothetical protein
VRPSNGANESATQHLTNRTIQIPASFVWRRALFRFYSDCKHVASSEMRRKKRERQNEQIDVSAHFLLLHVLLLFFSLSSSRSINFRSPGVAARGFSDANMRPRLIRCESVFDGGGPRIWRLSLGPELKRAQVITTLRRPSAPLGI